MSRTVIKVENLSKQYRLGAVSSGSISHDLNRLWHKMRGKDDPYLKISETNDRTKKGSSEYIWALQDINFEVKQGEVLGIIGRNGAGKSTLLKILSRTTAPTTGKLRMKGRIASLLEVGTGFHPELTGRENVYLNGAILGMTKAEISRKFDEIVDFAGVERYIDTPVKRYSSGMYVRLAFAVAAFLEPEILIIDEVLAVGDAEFQKKCLGRMRDVSVNDGRTVLFVSHNLSAIRQLCQTGLYFKLGQIHAAGEINHVLNSYTIDKPIDVSASIDLNTSLERTKNKQAYLTKIVFNEGQGIFYGDPLTVDIYFRTTKPVENLVAGFAFSNVDGARVATYDSEITVGDPVYFNADLPCEGKFTFSLGRVYLQPTLYNIDMGLRSAIMHSIDYLGACCTIEVQANEATPIVLSELKELGNIRQPIKASAILCPSIMQVIN